jgi:hypothetical protein
MKINIQTPDFLETLVGTGKKTIATIFITTALVIAFEFGAIATAFGNTIGIEKSAKENVRREIIRHITCPDFITVNSEANDVKALVSVDEQGNITVYEINAANPELKKYVANTLKEMKMKNAEATDKFVLVVKFRVD